MRTACMLWGNVKRPLWDAPINGKTYARKNGYWIEIQNLNQSVQALSGTTVTWDANSGINATLTLTGNTTITLSNLVAGTSGNLTITNPVAVYTLTFAGYTNKISPSVYSAVNMVLTSGGSKIDMYSWYYDGTYLVWNGSQDYK